MSMNIAKLQAQLEHIPDQTLISYIQNPQGEVPSYLALAELSRRKEIRKAATPKQAAPTQTVAQQEIAQAQPGIPGLPVREDMFQEKAMATGGIVAFEEGGPTSSDYAYGNAMDQSFLGWMPRAGMATFSDLAGLPGQYAWMRDPKTGKLVRRYEVEGWMPQISGFEASEAARRAGGEKKFAQAVAAEKANSPIAKAADRAVIADAMNMPAVSDAYMPNQGQRQFPTAKEVAAPAAPTAPGIASVAPRAAADRAYTPSQFNVPSVDYKAIPFDQAAFDKMKEEAPTAEAERDRFKTLVGENAGLAALTERLGKMESKAAQEEERAPWMALARAGLGMAAGKSRSAVQNIAEGATAGLADYAAAKDKLAAAEEKRFALQSQLAQAQRAEDLAAAKFGEDSVQHIKAQNRATDLAALTAKTNIETTNASNELKAKEATAKNAIDVQQLRVTEKHYNDWYNVSLKTAEKSLQGIEKQGIQQQTQILNNLLDEANTQIKNIAADMNATPQDRINAQAKYDAIQQRLMSLTGVDYKGSSAPTGPRQKPLDAFGR